MTTPTSPHPTPTPRIRQRIGCEALIPWSWGEALVVILTVALSTAAGTLVMRSELANLMPSVGKVGVRILVLIATYAIQYIVLAFMVRRRHTTFPVLYRLPLSAHTAQTVRTLCGDHSPDLSGWERVRTWLTAIGSVLGLFLLVRIAGMGWVLLTESIGWLPPSSDQLYDLFGRSEFGLALAITAVVVVAPLVEEIIFRVVVQGWVGEKAPAWVAIGVSSLLFAASHLSLWALVPNIVLGIVTGYLAYRRATLWPAVILHAIYNASLVWAAFYTVL